MWSRRNVRGNCKGLLYRLLQPDANQQKQPLQRSFDQPPPPPPPPPTWMRRAPWSAAPPQEGEERRLYWETNLVPLHRHLFQTSTARRPLLFELLKPVCVPTFAKESSSCSTGVKYGSQFWCRFNSVPISLQFINLLHQLRPFQGFVSTIYIPFYILAVQRIYRRISRFAFLTGWEKRSNL